MRHLAVGDIHGCLKSLRTLAEFVPFKPDDVLITLGDYVDRGPDSRGVLDWLIDYQQRGNLIPLRGNHEVMMLDAREDDTALREWLEWTYGLPALRTTCCATRVSRSSARCMKSSSSPCETKGATSRHEMRNGDWPRKAI